MSCGAIAFAALAVSPACAQQADESAQSGIEEIVVTAQRSETKLQDTPLSIVAVGGDQLEKQGTDSLSGFDTFIPNVTIGGTAAQGNAIINVAIRGIGGAPQGFVTQEGAVGIYVDDILFARPNGALLDLLDVERVEVLRGPQGTLFGRNTAGGAIRYVSKAPSDKLEGSIKAVAGSRDRFEVSGILNLPLAEGLATRLAFAKKSRDGYVHRIIDDTYVGGGDSTTMRGQLRWEPAAGLEINLTGDLIRTSDNGQPTLSVNFSPTDLYPAQLYGVAIPGDPAPNPAIYNSMRALAPLSVSPSGYTNAAADFAYYYGQVQGGYEVYGGLLPDVNKFRSYGLSGTIAYDLADMLTVKSLTGYRKISQIQNQDWDRTPIPLVQLNDTTDIEYLTQELQLNGSFFGDSLKWVSGVFYYWDDSTNVRRRFDPSAGANSAFKGDTGKGTYESKRIKTESIAVFTQGTYNITSALSATLGLRWGKDSKDFTSFREGRGQVCISGGSVVAAVGSPASCPAGSVSTPSAQSVSDNWSSVSPRVSLDYRWSPEVMTYVSAAKGYKGGGFNDSLQTRCYRSPLANCGLNQYDDENLWTYEFGIRSDLFDRKVRLNITAFLTKYKAQQIQLADPGPPPLVYTVNGDSTVKGLEVEFLAAPTTGLILKANLGYVDATYDQDIRGASGTVAITPDVPFYRSPKWSYSLGASYEVPVGDAGDVSFDLNWGWKDKQLSYPSPTNFVELPSYGLLNGRVSFAAKGGWTVSLFGNNLTDKYYLTGGFDPSGPSSKPTTGLSGVPHDRVFGFTMLDIGRPRELGIEVGYKF
ncbi:TonB-dependent receptor [Sphingomonas canadensis]|uniref:TonB-dependent receptor n=1 Tax=Sphingomonas canadensis TaxID=1219257 RepID=A0ABW3HDC4_9SPHN|nr:TonB-dependent receptor [Sphingomonas canadensis]MCW3837011.1 TonB-dependent receptor [Sphingomonas canadensis]